MELGRKEIQTDLPRLGECELSVFYFPCITLSALLHCKLSHLTVWSYCLVIVTIIVWAETKCLCLLRCVAVIILLKDHFSTFAGFAIVSANRRRKKQGHLWLADHGSDSASLLVEPMESRFGSRGNRKNRRRAMIGFLLYPLRAPSISLKLFLNELRLKTILLKLSHTKWFYLKF